MAEVGRFMLQTLLNDPEGKTSWLLQSNAQVAKVRCQDTLLCYGIMSSSGLRMSTRYSSCRCARPCGTAESTVTSRSDMFMAVSRSKKEVLEMKVLVMKPVSKSQDIVFLFIDWLYVWRNEPLLRLSATTAMKHSFLSAPRSYQLQYHLFSLFSLAIYT